ncbi:gliding motility-associated C-terminal domain-containing protein [Flavitalea sp. BT771]|uniref:T9SS type B sorting domain-containing protein n=1 Tax=Flavitalea sp. BT771 TaxID=3063329 RepID=UPI0026E3BF9A|nr:gliding motility-associated C-terminal domain-containing protein [Flavitalea sp. BT771]MDO6429221.1 gliding motility-associated C-terminal domain-containing protein [Flavitalea sp. BT771]MDV6218651.1 gliding motility-associated C-terminal domain-containing protein [Flavitalea sp. BT771]
MSPWKLPGSLFCTAALRILIIQGLLLFQAPVFSQKVVSTIAGTGVPAFSGDGGPALNAGLDFPLGICFDPAGNMYIADFSNQCVRKVDAVTGDISTIAGSGGNNGFSGDGGPAVSARLNHPLRVCADKNNHLFVIDYENLRVRRVDLATGIITTIAGNGTANYVNGGLAVNGGLVPFGIAVDQAGHLYISQPETNAGTPTHLLISRLDLSSGIITTVAGSGQPGDITGYGGSPPGLACDAAGELYAAGGVYGGVSKIDPVTGLITHVPVNIPTTQPMDVVVDGLGHLIVSDMTGAQVISVDLQTGAGTVVAGDGVTGMGPDCVTPTASRINYPMGLALDGQGNICFSEMLNNRVRKILTPPALPPMTVLASVNPVCAGQAVTFTARVTNASGGTFRWSVNGSPVSGNSDTYVTKRLSDGDKVACELTIAAAGTCGFTSNAVTVRVLSASSPSISISTPSTILCGVNTAEFTAFVTNAGDHPTYQWLLNGSPVGNNSDTYDAAGLADNDEVACRLTGDPTYICSTVPPVTSVPIHIDIVPDAPPTIRVTASANPICPGDSVVFKATAQDVGAGFSYQWMINGARTGVSSDTYGNAHLKDGDIVSCALDPGNTPCRTGQPVTSGPLTISVRKVPEIVLPFADTTILPGRQIVLQASIQGNAQSWQWSPADALINPAALTPLTVAMTATTDFHLTAFSMEGCPVYGDIAVRVFYKLVLPNSFTPNGDGRNDLFRIPPFVTLELEEFSVYDRWGNKVFSTRHAGTGWDGTRNGQACAAGTYVYVIKGKTIQGEVLSKGTVLLVR